MLEQYGGSGVDRLYMILIEEQAYAMDSSTGFSLHSDIVANFINNFGNEEQKKKWLPKMATGDGYRNCHDRAGNRFRLASGSYNSRS